MGLYEGAKKVLAGPDHTRNGFARYADRTIARLGDCTVYLYVVLIAELIILLSGSQLVSKYKHSTIASVAPGLSRIANMGHAYLGYRGSTLSGLPPGRLQAWTDGWQLDNLSLRRGTCRR